MGAALLLLLPLLLLLLTEMNALSDQLGVSLHHTHGACM